MAIRMKDIEGFEGRYAITDDGRVWSYWKKGFLKGQYDRDGYHIVNLLIKDNKFKPCKVHRLVAKAFIPNPDNLHEVNHKDENKANNEVSNLEWCTHRYNSTYGTKIQRQLATRLTKKIDKLVYCIELDKVFRSQRQAAIQLNIDPMSIWAVLHGKWKTAGGYHWKYIEEVEK